MPRDQATKAAEEWLERLELSERRDDKLDQLSKGNQQKVQFISFPHLTPMKPETQIAQVSSNAIMAAEVSAKSR